MTASSLEFPSTGQANNSSKKRKVSLSFFIVFDHLSVILWLDEGDIPENLQIVCVIIKKCSFEPFM